MCVCVCGWGLVEIVVSSINNGRQNSEGHIALLIYDQTESSVLLSDYKYSHTWCASNAQTHTQMHASVQAQRRKSNSYGNVNSWKKVTKP